MKIMTRVVSCATLLCFVMTQNLFAAPGMGIEIVSSRETPSLLQIDIPAELATLDGLYEAPFQQDPKLILHIQNAHANYGAQQKIKELLQYLEKHYAMKTIFVEGASEDLNPDYLKMFPDRERNMKLAEFLAKQGELTGAELYLLEADNPGLGTRDSSLDKTQGPNKSRGTSDVSRTDDRKVTAYGIEDAGLYRENYDALKKVFGSEATVRRYLDEVEGRLSTLASKVFSKDLLKLLGEWKKFEKGHREFMPYVKSLAAESKKALGIDLESLLSQIEWPQITRLLVLQTMEKELDMQKGLAERDQLIRFLKEKRVSTNLITAIENFRAQQVTVLQGTRVGASAPVEPAKTGTTSSRERTGVTGVQPRDLMEQLVIEVGPKGFYFYNYPHFSLYAGYLILKSEVDPKGLFGEIRVLFTRILDRLAESQREKKLLELYRNEELVRKLLNLELTRKDWQEVLVKKDLLAMDPLVAELKEIGTAVSRETGLPLSNFETKPVNPKFKKSVTDVQDAAYRFYEAARKREDVFYKKIDSVMQKESLNKAVLITGGFHTDGITELLREHEVSYGILTPRLSEKSDESLYRSVMLQSKPRVFELSYLEAVSRLESFRVQRQQLGENEVLQNLKPVLRAIGYAGNFGDIKDAIEIFNQSVYAINAGIRINPVKVGEEEGKPVYQVVRRSEAREESPRTSFENAIKDLQAKDPALYEHSVRVRDLCVLIAQKMGLGPVNTAILSDAATFHDLGKILVPDSILQKPGALDPFEEDVIKLHPKTGAALVPMELLFREIVQEIVEMHHAENYVNLLTSIVTAADYFDARTSGRPYHAPLPPPEVIAALGQEPAKFDSKVVNVLEMLVNNGQWKTRSEMSEGEAEDGERARVDAGEPGTEPGESGRSEMRGEIEQTSGEAGIVREKMPFASLTVVEQAKLGLNFEVVRDLEVQGSKGPVLVAAVAGMVFGDGLKAEQMADVVLRLASASVTRATGWVNDIRGIFDGLAGKLFGKSSPVEIMDKQGLEIELVPADAFIEPADLGTLANKMQGKVVVLMADGTAEAEAAKQRVKEMEPGLAKTLKGLNAEKRFDMIVIDKSDSKNARKALDRFIAAKMNAMPAISKGPLGYVLMGSEEFLRVFVTDAGRGLMIKEPFSKNVGRRVATSTLASIVSQRILSAGEADAIKEVLNTEKDENGFRSFSQDALTKMLSIAMQVMQAIQSAA